MAESTWWNITHGMAEAVDKGYKRKSRKQRQRKEVADVWRRTNDFCWEMQELLGRGEYQVGQYRHFKLHDRKKVRDISVLPFAGRVMKTDTMEGICHTIVDFAEKPSKQKDCEHYYHVQAIAEGLGLVVYSTGSAKICDYLATKTKHDLPLRDMVIVHDWSGMYYDGTVYTDAEEEEMIRKQFNIPK